MPAKDYNAYMREYMSMRWFNRRRRAVEQLGGRCSNCGGTENLHFDHIDPGTKIMTIARMSSASEKRFQEELAKCQLLCEDCHKKKTYASIA